MTCSCCVLQYYNIRFFVLVKSVHDLGVSFYCSCECIKVIETLILQCVPVTVCEWKNLESCATTIFQCVGWMISFSVLVLGWLVAWLAMFTLTVILSYAFKCVPCRWQIMIVCSETRYVLLLLSSCTWCFMAFKWFLLIVRRFVTNWYRVEI